MVRDRASRSHSGRVGDRILHFTDGGECYVRRRHIPTVGTPLGCASWRNFVRAKRGSMRACGQDEGNDHPHTFGERWIGADALGLIVEAEILQDCEHSPGHATGTSESPLFGMRLRRGLRDHACDELLRWYRDALTTGGDFDSSRRAVCRQLMGSSVTQALNQSATSAPATR